MCGSSHTGPVGLSPLRVQARCAADRPLTTALAAPIRLSYVPFLVCQRDFLISLEVFSLLFYFQISGGFPSIFLLLSSVYYDLQT